MNTYNSVIYGKACSQEQTPKWHVLQWDWIRELLHTSVPSFIQHKNLTLTSLLSKIAYDDILEVKEWNSFHLSMKKQDYLHLEDFLKYECELYLKQPLTPPQCKIIVSYCT